MLSVFIIEAVVVC